MILLNSPWSQHELDLALARRRQSLARTICLILWCAGFLMIGYALGAWVYSTP